MKKLGFMVMPLMVVSLLASCGGSNPAPSIDYCIVDFDTDGGSHIAAQKVEKGKTATPPTTKPTHSSTQEFTFDFNGWDFDFATPITSDTTIKAKWKKETQVYTVTFNANGGELVTGTEPTITVPYGKAFKDIPGLAEQKANKSNHQFLGWAETSTDKQNISEDYVIQGDKEVFANFTPTTPVEVTFSGSSLNCTLYTADGQSATPGQKVTVPAGISTKLTVQVNDSEVYLPLFEDKITITGDASHEFNLVKKEIIITVAQGSSCVITAVAETPRESLEEYKWSEISQLSEMGLANEFFNVGEEKTVNLFDISADTNTRTEQSFAHTVRIIDFNHDKDINGNDLGITFEFENVITKGTTTPTDVYTTIWDGEYQVSGDNYDYRSSVLNKALNDKTSGVDSIINRLPDDLKEVIKPANKKVGVNESKQEGAQYYEAKSFKTGEYPKLFSLAHDEMVDHVDYAVQDEGTKYQYYKEHTSETDRIKTKVGGGGENYWLRSPTTYDSNFAWIVLGDGILYDSFVYGYADAVAPAFCI